MLSNRRGLDPWGQRSTLVLWRGGLAAAIDSTTLPPNLLGDPHYNAPNVRQTCKRTGRELVTTQYGSYSQTDIGVEGGPLQLCQEVT